MHINIDTVQYVYVYILSLEYHKKYLYLQIIYTIINMFIMTFFFDFK